MHRRGASGVHPITSACFAVCVLLVIPVPAEAQVPRLWGDLRPGPNGVGYRVVRLFDQSRSFGLRTAAAEPGASAPNRRLMTVRVWYPATSARGVRMTLRSYLDLLDKDGPITADVRERLELDLNGIWSDLCTCRVPRAAADARLDALFGTTAAAVRDATPATGRHPVIVYSLGHDMHSLENVVLWEYLASHGYVVAVTPSVGHQSVAMEPVGPTSAEVKTRDLEFVTHWLRTVPFADMNRVAAVGFSLGGWSALMLGMRSGDINAVVALDGSFNLPNRVASVRTMPFFRPSAFMLPMLNLRQDEPEIDVGVIESFANAERFDTAIGDMDPPNASHHSFTSIYTFSTEFFPPDGNGNELMGLKYNRDVFELVATRVRLFLDAYLKGTAEARAALQQPPRVAGVPDALIRHRYLAPASR